MLPLKGDIGGSILHLPSTLSNSFCSAVIQNLTNNNMELFNNSLLQELLNYGEDKSLEFKVKRIHSKCVKHRKLALADKIEIKYRRFFRGSDRIMSLQWAILAEQQLKGSK